MSGSVKGFPWVLSADVYFVDERWARGLCVLLDGEDSWDWVVDYWIGGPDGISRRFEQEETSAFSLTSSKFPTIPGARDPTAECGGVMGYSRLLDVMLMYGTLGGSNSRCSGEHSTSAPTCPAEADWTLFRREARWRKWLRKGCVRQDLGSGSGVHRCWSALNRR